MKSQKKTQPAAKYYRVRLVYGKWGIDALDAKLNRIAWYGPYATYDDACDAAPTIAQTDADKASELPIGKAAYNV